VAFTLGGLSILYAVCFLEPDSLHALPPRIMGIMNNIVLLAVPLFVFMGMMLERSGLAERLLETMAMLFGRMRGGLAVSVVLVGALLAASTGIVGATVIAMGLISLPLMLRRGYAPELATGVIASSGTLGQVIPPSVVLILLGSVLQVSVGELFRAALVPGLLLVLAYLVYVLLYAHFRPKKAPAVSIEELVHFRREGFAWRVTEAFAMPLLLIGAVLGSILTGIASPTEAAGVGALGAVLLTAIQGRLKLSMLKQVMQETTLITSMVFMILLGATTFSFVFRELEGDQYLLDLIAGSNLSAQGFIVLFMILVFIAGFFIDFIEIIFILVPVVAPILVQYDVDLIWVGILLAFNLQTSFLTPPFGFSLFYLKGVAPAGITTAHLYRGILPFVLIQLLFLALLFWFPGLMFRA
jgi:tripartite ATP-independent transporter DctM subunit